MSHIKTKIITKKTRRDFIGPFFTAIDLEIDNEEDYN